MATFNTPGVYIQEISKLPASVAQVETAIPAFIGHTENAVADPVRIRSMAEFEETFGGPDESIAVSVAGAGSAAVATVGAPDTTYSLYYCMQLYFANGGGPCYVISAGEYDDAIAEGNFTAALDNKLKRLDEPTLIVIPEAVKLAVANFKNVVDKAMAQCAELQDRFTIMDVHGEAPGTFRTSGVGTSNLKYGAAYYPNLNTTLIYPDTAVTLTGGDWTGETLAEAIAAAAAETGPTTPKSDSLNAMMKDIRDAVAGNVITLPPSSAMAGIYAAVDASRGVWKAPANVSLNAVTAPTIKLNNEDQETLNVDPNGKSINAIRTFTGKGVLVWGSRTLDGNSNEWRYVPVRRLFITAEESIKKATEFVVFEPNDGNTWTRVRGLVENYLTGLWRQGALAGAKPEDAFFVKVGLGETMTSLDILEGRLIVEIGMAAVRPAEFIILRFSHKLQES